MRIGARRCEPDYRSAQLIAIRDSLCRDPARADHARGAIGLIALKDRSLSPVAGLFVQSAVPIGKAIQPKRTTRVTRK